MNPQLIQRAAEKMRGTSDDFFEHLSVWLQGVAFALTSGRLSAGSNEACHAHKIAAAYLAETP